MGVSVDLSQKDPCRLSLESQSILTCIGRVGCAWLKGKKNPNSTSSLILLYWKI